LARDELTLAEILRKAGYATGAVVGGPWMKRVFGLDKGFDYYDDAQISTFNGRLASQVTASALRWIEKSQKRNFFLFLNYFDPHHPYMPPEGFAFAFLPRDTKLNGREVSVEQINALYDAEILYMDHYLGQLVKYLKAHDLHENTFIIVTADHGELLGEHGMSGHGTHLTQQELHVPLFLKYPSNEVSPGRTDVPVQLNDIFAIILERVGIEKPKNIQAGTPPEVGHPILAEVYPRPALSQEGDWRAIFEGDFKFVWNSKGHNVLFNLRNDPGESDNLVLQLSEKAARMLLTMNEYLTKLPKPGPPAPAQEVDESTKRALKSLGYVN
jgi:arylsulfatase A-like enzyme